MQEKESTTHLSLTALETRPTVTHRCNRDMVDYCDTPKTHHSLMRHFEMQLQMQIQEKESTTQLSLTALDTRPANTLRKCKSNLLLQIQFLRAMRGYNALP